MKPKFLICPLPTLSGTVQLLSENWHTIYDLTFTGSGTLQLDAGSTIGPQPNTTTRRVHTWTIDCNVCGDGTIEVPPDKELIFEGQARVEVARIDCGGLLRVRGSAAPQQPYHHPTGVL